MKNLKVKYAGVTFTPLAVTDPNNKDLINLRNSYKWTQNKDMANKDGYVLALLDDDSPWRWVKVVK